MAEETQLWPLAHKRSDEENPTFKTLRKERSNKCFVYIFSFIVLLCALVLIFALIALRAASPHVELTAVHVQSLSHTNTSFSATLAADLFIKNPNFGPYKFEGNNSASFLHNGTNLGETKISRGTADVKGTRRVNMTMRIGMDLLTDDQLSRDLSSGMLNLTCYSSFTGKVYLIRVLKVRKTVKMNCTMTLVLQRKQIKDLICN